MTEVERIEAEIAWSQRWFGRIMLFVLLVWTPGVFLVSWLFKWGIFECS